MILRGGSAVISSKRPRIGDVVAIILVLACALLPMVLPRLMSFVSVGIGNGNDGDGTSTCLLEVQAADGVREYSLAEDGRYEISSRGYSLVIVVSDGAASVLQSDCKCGICTAHAPIRDGGESIICLPAEVVLRIRSNTWGGATDGEAG